MSNTQRDPNSRASKVRLVVLTSLMLVVITASFGAGVWAAPYVRAQIAPEPTPAPGLTEQLAPLYQAWGLVQDRFVFKNNVDQQKMTYGAIQGMLSTLDDEGHTRFLSPDEVKLEQSSLEGRFEGIGAEVTTRNGLTTIVTPIEGSPAEKAGILPGDVVASVDGKDVTTKTLTEVVDMIRGPRGTTVTLQIARPGHPGLMDVKIVRDEIKVTTVSWAMVPGTTVAHVKLSQFAQTSDSELRQALKDARAAGATGLVLDLRNDPGGLLDQAIAVGSEFVGQGSLLQQEDRDGTRKSYDARPGGVATDLPMVVLVNEGSASASEIVAGALQDHQRAQVIGAKTFGTGTVLSSFSLDDGSALLLGTAQWLTPNGRAIRKDGIHPDIEVPQTLDTEMLTPLSERTMMPDQLKQSADKQLLRAADALQGNPASSGQRGRTVTAYAN